MLGTTFHRRNAKERQTRWGGPYDSIAGSLARLLLRTVVPYSHREILFVPSSESMQVVVVVDVDTKEMSDADKNYRT